MLGVKAQARATTAQRACASAVGNRLTLNPRAVSDRDLTKEAFERIKRDDATLQAWVLVDPAAAEREPRGGPLSGTPFGVKDVIDVAGLPTRLGMPWDAEPARLDAWCVAALRAAGAVPIGKTQTTPFAFKDPAATRNPRAAGRTPGGSSSGSAAAVAAGHVPFALGTQTIGSTLRPASYCGIAGFKPTYGVIPTSGVAPLAPSLDHVGLLARDVSIMRSVASIFIDEASAHEGAAFAIGVDAQLFAERFVAKVPRGLRTTAALLRDAGATVVDVAMPGIVAESVEHLMTMVAFEAHAVLRHLRPRGFPPQIDALVERGSRTSYDDYRAALAHRARTRPRMVALLERFDATMLALAGEAPEPGTTGDVMPLGSWSYWGVPAVTVPMICGAAGLPIGLQLIAAPGHDARLLAVAHYIEKTIAEAIRA